MAQKPLTTKIIEVDLTLTQVGATFGENQGNTKHIQGLACDVTIEKVGLPSKNTATIDIFNLKQSDIEKITTTSPRKLDVKRNIVTVRAYEEGGFPGEVFQGEIFLAYGTYDSADLGVHIEAITGVYPSLKVSRPFTHEGEIDAIKVIEKYVNEMEGYTFEKHPSITPKFIRDPVVNGSPIDKIEELSRMVNVQVIIDDMIVKVLPWNEALQGKAVKVSAKTGMIGYPAFNSNGINVFHEYRPHFIQGGMIEVESIVPKASGQWKIVKMTHQLQSFGAGPNWKTYMECIYPESGGSR